MNVKKRNENLINLRCCLWKCVLLEAKASGSKVLALRGLKESGNMRTNFHER